MFHQPSTDTSSFFGGEIDTTELPGHPATFKPTPAPDLGDETQLGRAQWESMVRVTSNPGCASHQAMDESMHFLSSLSSSITPPAKEDVFSFSSSSTASSPHISHLSVTDRQTSIKEAGEPAGQLPDIDEVMQEQKASARRSQNRQAQRRFRERKEQQKSQLVDKLDELQTNHDRMASLLETVRQRNRITEVEKKRLEREVEMLRKWRGRILGLMSDIIQHDGTADDLLMKVETSCSTECWRKGMQHSRAFIIMQTLLALFEEGQVSSSSTARHGAGQTTEAQDKQNDGQGIDK